MHDQTETALQVAVNQDLLDDIEEPEEPAVEPDNDEFHIDLSEEEEEEEEEEDPMYEEDPDQEAPEQIDAEQLSDAGSSHTSRSHTSRSRQTSDIYSRPYRPNPRRVERNSELIASEDDLDILDDEGDFELNEEEEEEELEEEEEEEEEELMEEEEEMASFEDSDEEKPKPRPKRKAAPKKKKDDSDQNLTLVDTDHFKRKLRIFTKDVEDPSAVVSNPVCAFCGQPDDASLGGFLSAAPFVNRDQRVFTHLACALSSLEVARSATAFYNVIKAVNRGKKIRCAACHRYGASLICCITGCLK